MSDTALGRQVIYSVVGTPDNIDNLDAGRNDAAFWSGVREGRSRPTKGSRPCATGRPSRGSPPPRTATSRRPARRRCACSTSSRRALDCSNARRLHNLTTFIVPATNPDGRDLNQPHDGVGLRPEPRPRHAREHGERRLHGGDRASTRACSSSTPTSSRNGYFFPPNEDAVHHEVSQFALDFIQRRHRPDAAADVQRPDGRLPNYNTYDLFAPSYGDSVPALLDGARRHDLREGRRARTTASRSTTTTWPWTRR